MTFRDFRPDLVRTIMATHDVVAKRCKSMDDICYCSSSKRLNKRAVATHTDSNRVNISGNDFRDTNESLNRSFDHVQNVTTTKARGICRQESCPGEMDIELEAHPLKLTAWQPHCKCCRICSEPLPRGSDPLSSFSESLHNGSDSLSSSTNTPHCLITDDETEGATIQKHPGENNTQEGLAIAPGTSSDQRLEDLEDSQRTQRRIQQTTTEPIFKKLPDVQQSGELEEKEDKQLFHEIASVLKTYADNFDKKPHEKSAIQALQETFKIDVTEVLLPQWVQQGIVPTLLKSSLNIALQYYRL